MFRVVAAADDLPAPGTPEGLTLDFKAMVPNRWTSFRLAYQVAGFANAVGGVLIVGGRDERDALKEYQPLPVAAAKDAESRYGNAVKERCSPKPLIEIKRIRKDDGFVVAVNIWPFVGQAVGVRGQTDQSAEGKAIVAYTFPLRSGRDTVTILPEQLPMLMLPDLRRTQVLLESIPAEREVWVTCETHYECGRKLRIVNVDVLHNVVVFLRTQGRKTEQLHVPLD